MGSGPSKKKQKPEQTEPDWDKVENKEFVNDKAKQKKDELNRTNNNNAQRVNTHQVSGHVQTLENGAQIHMPGGTNNGEQLETDNRSPNEIKAEQERTNKELQKQQEEAKRAREIEEKESDFNRKGLQKNLKYTIEKIKETYKSKELSTWDVENAARRVRKHEKYTTHELGPKLDTTPYQDKRRELSKQKQETARLMHKLSEIASAKLRHNNANLTDLSDPNRASKLAERLSELYDNEWTDVFDVVKKKAVGIDDRDIVQSLLDILKFCYQKTLIYATKQTQLLYEALHKNEANTSIQFTLLVQNLQKKTVNVSKAAFQKSVRQQVSKDMKMDTVVTRISPDKPPLSNYINLCAELTWYMHIQSPPMELDFKGADPSVTRFRPYLSTGSNLHYIVWPALLLHTDGPVVAKGVAEYTNANVDNKNNGKSGKGQKHSKESNHTDSQWD